MQIPGRLQKTGGGEALEGAWLAGQIQSSEAAFWEPSFQANLRADPKRWGLPTPTHSHLLIGEGERMNVRDLTIKKGSPGPHQPGFAEENEAGTEPRKGNFTSWGKAGGVAEQLVLCAIQAMCQAIPNA